jgi:hypothetical protein
MSDGSDPVRVKFYKGPKYKVVVQAMYDMGGGQVGIRHKGKLVQVRLYQGCRIATLPENNPTTELQVLAGSGSEQ